MQSRVRVSAKREVQAAKSKKMELQRGERDGDADCKAPMVHVSAAPQDSGAVGGCYSALLGRGGGVLWALPLSVPPAAMPSPLLRRVRRASHVLQILLLLHVPSGLMLACHRPVRYREHPMKAKCGKAAYRH